MHSDDPPNPLAPTELVWQWFDRALDGDDPKPNLQQCAEFARAIQIIVNQENNRLVIRKEGIKNALPRLKDISLPEILEEFKEEVRDAGRHLLFAINEFQNYAGEDDVGITERVTCNEVAELMARIGALVPKDIKAKKYTSDVIKDILDAVADDVRDADGSISYSDAIDKLADKGLVGRSTETYEADGKTHEIRAYSGIIDFLDQEPLRAWPAESGRRIAREIQGVMIRLGYKGSLSEIQERSVTAAVGAAAVSWAYGRELKTPAGFVTGIRPRTRVNKAGGVQK
jgi:hypothetical protein